MNPKYHLHNRPNREINSKKEIINILQNGKYVTISMCRNNEPYIVTLSYGYDINTHSLYLHASPKGLKIDFINTNPNVCATIIEDGGYVIDECAHNYRSVVFWGMMTIPTDPDEKRYGMKVLVNHLEIENDVIADKLKNSEEYYSKMTVLKIEINEIHGKKGR